MVDTDEFMAQAAHWAHQPGDELLASGKKIKKSLLKSGLQRVSQSWAAAAPDRPAGQ